MSAFAIALVLLLGGCTSLRPDAGFGEVERAVEQRAGVPTRWARDAADKQALRDRVAHLLAQPLGPEQAVEVALLNNPGLQSAYADVGIAEAELVQASRWRGPTFSFARLRRGDETEWERSVFFDVLGLITIPLSVAGEEARFAAAQQRAAGEALRTALETRKAWFNAVAARESVRYMEQVKAAAEASAILAERMASAGNWSKLEQAREQLFLAETLAQLTRARHLEASTRERLARLLGLWGDQVGFTLPERLPDLPALPRADATDLEAQAIAQRVDVEAARQEVTALAHSLGLTKTAGLVGLAEIGVHSNSETGRPRQRGFEIELGLPLFDFGAARLARAERTYQQAAERARAVAVQARSEVREAYHAYRTQFDVAKGYRDDVVPLRKRISEEMLLRYNGMLVSVFELLADARAQVIAVNAYIEALRDFWLAESDLQMALTAGSPRSNESRRAAAAPSASTAAGH